MAQLFAIRLQDKLRASLKKKGVRYTQIYAHGSFVYSNHPEKRNHLFTVCVGDKSTPVCWNPDEGWKKGTHAHPGIDPRRVARQRFTQLIRKAFR